MDRGQSIYLSLVRQAVWRWNLILYWFRAHGANCYHCCHLDGAALSGSNASLHTHALIERCAVVGVDCQRSLNSVVMFLTARVHTAGWISFLFDAPYFSANSLRASNDTWHIHNTPILINHLHVFKCSAQDLHWDVIFGFRSVLRVYI